MKKFMTILSGFALALILTTSAMAASVTLYWTAPGDDGATGTAASYDMRWSLNPITLANWSSATQVTGEPTPTAAGTTQNMTVTGLNGKTVHFFAIRTTDAAGNVSGLSNVFQITTPDDVPPAAITDLRATP